jgi:predicted nucleotidyltransferase component of viral defense system
VSGIALTAGRIARHAPRNVEAGGQDAAIIDIAQDLLLRSLHEEGVLDALVFKGGTALRKLYAGQQGRFSTDLDFSLVSPTDHPDDVVEALVIAIEGRRIGPFTYGATHRRGKWMMTLRHDLGDAGSGLSSKIDVSPPVWVDPVRRGWVPMDVHAVYGDPPLPNLQTMRLEENLAEKISRLNRTTTARDMYDLAWIAANERSLGGLDRSLLRRLAILKIWVDAHGVAASHAKWKPAHEAAAFDPDHWLRERRADEFDLEDIGALAVPPPSAKELAAQVKHHYAFLADLDGIERQLAVARGQDRPLALRELCDLPGGRLCDLGLY